MVAEKNVTSRIKTVKKRLFLKCSIIYTLYSRDYKINKSLIGVGYKLMMNDGVLFQIIYCIIMSNVVHSHNKPYGNDSKLFCLPGNKGESLRQGGTIINPIKSKVQLFIAS